MLGDGSTSATKRAESFHSSMAMALLDQVRKISVMQRFDRIGLAGGVFQNRVLTDQVVHLLEADGYEVHLGLELPCNDASISFGQVAECAALDGLGKN
jgi:hydrogenase maturation protein HypF